MAFTIKLLFLDVDGVLNSEEYFTSDRYTTSYPLSEFDPKAIERLNKILPYCDRLILSSSWRETDNIEKILKEAGVKEEFLEDMLMTPMLSNVFSINNSLRGHEIDFVVKNFQRDFTWVNYVILDDEDYQFMPFQKDHLVTTSYADGLTDEMVEKAIDVLMNDQLSV